MIKRDEASERKRETLILELSGSFRKMIRLLQNDINTRFAEHMPYNEFLCITRYFKQSTDGFANCE